MVTAPNVTVMRENIEINFFLHRKKMCEPITNTDIIFKKITQTLFLIYTHVPVLERGKHVDLT